MPPPKSDLDRDPEPSSSPKPPPATLVSASTQLPSRPSAGTTATRRTSHKLQKKRRDEPHTPTMELPERLKGDENEGEGEEDLLSPSNGGYMNMNQSIFGIFAAAGSRININEGQSSDEEDESGDGREETHAHHPLAMTELRGIAKRRDGDRNAAGSQMSQSTVLQKPNSLKKRDSDKSGGTVVPERHHRRKLSGSRILAPVISKLSNRKSNKSGKGKGLEEQIHEEQEEEDTMDAALKEAIDSSISSPTLNIKALRNEGGVAPVMSSMLAARAEMAARPSFDMERTSMDRRIGNEVGDTGPSNIAKKLAEIFEFDEPEDVIEEYPCWLLQHVLLQGYMYITSKHIAFYAYLPKRAHEVAKSGYLSKSGKRNPKYHRYWFRLKGDVLSYYRDSQNLYFPSGQIDLRYGISAAVMDKEKDKDKEGLHFTITTHHRTYYFKADSATSAKEWVKSLQRVIFRSHNDGDSVKISLPIENVIDVEETHMLDWADTCKLRVIDNDETYAIDEYFFSFFTFGKEALNVLKILVEGSGAGASEDDRLQQPSDAKGSSKDQSSAKTSTSGRDSNQGLPKIRTSTRLNEGVRATLSPISPGYPHQQSPIGSPRASGELPRGSFDALRPFGRRSTEVGQLVASQDSPRRSFSQSRQSSRNRLDRKQETPRKHGSSDSYMQSVEDPSQASFSGMMASGSDDPSASQILQGSDIFHSPTMKCSASATRVPHPEQSKQGPVRQQTSGLAKYSARHAATTGHMVDPSAGEKPEGLPIPPTLQNLGKMTGLPFQKANQFMGYTRRMSNLFATESMGYVEKVSGMWKGGKKHYAEPAELKTDEEGLDVDAEDRFASNERFREHFALPEGETLQAAYFGYIIRVIPLYGKIYISDRHFCFRSLLPASRTKLILPLKDIETVDKEKGFRFGYSGLVVVIRGHEELFFEFGKSDIRDDCCITAIRNIEAVKYLRESSMLGSNDFDEAQIYAAERDALQEIRNEERSEYFVDSEIPPVPAGIHEAPTILFDDAKASFLAFKPPPMRITCLTIGSRGDVQPYIALCKALIREGHHPKIATHAEFKDWIEGHGIEFGLVEGDPNELMQLCIENGTFSPSFFRVANSKFRPWVDGLLSSSWKACQGSDLLIESPSAMAGIHIAEALGIPYFRAFGMPWTRTRAYPHAFIQPNQKLGGAYNYITYVMFETLFWSMTASQINRWRNNDLNLPATRLERMQPNKVPMLYFLSPTVVPPPLDYPDWIRVTGYWFLDEGGAEWTPPKELTDFIEKARRDDKKIVYVGFGSIIVPDPAKMTQDVIDAVLKADVRCILSKGWSDRETAMQQNDGTSASTGPHKKPEPKLPPEILQIKSAPHDWLFAQIDAAAHHGGSGTTGASLRAGIPTIVRPFFGDQYFSASRVEDLGVGIHLKKWGGLAFGRALWTATHDKRMITKAKVLGEAIRKENGVDTAIQYIYRDLEYAKSLIKRKAGKNAVHRNSLAQGDTEALDNLDDEDDDPEEWTFVGADADVADAEDTHHAAAAVAELTDPANRGKALGSQTLRSSLSGTRDGAVEMGTSLWNWLVGA